MGTSQLKVSPVHKTIRSYDYITRVVGQDLHIKMVFLLQNILYDYGENRPFFLSHWQEVGRGLEGENLNK